MDAARLFDMTGERALVTGASKGLGQHFATVLARHGAAVALAARSTDALAEVRAEIEAAGGRAVALALDVTDRARIEAAVGEAAAALGGLSVVINNAGIAVAKPALDQTDAEFDGVIDTNLKGVFWVAVAAARHMAQAGGGAIVNVASVLGEAVIGNLAPYSASKAGVIHMTRALALEWARHGIRINALAPGYVETEMNRDFFATDKGQALLLRVAQRRLGRLADLDGPLLLLASRASAFMTGTTVRVDGGFGLV